MVKRIQKNAIKIKNPSLWSCPNAQNTMARPGKKLFKGSMPKGTAIRTPERMRMKASIRMPNEPRINKAKRGLVNFSVH